MLARESTSRVTQRHAGDPAGATPWKARAGRRRWSGRASLPLPPSMSAYVNCVVPGIATGSTGLGPNSYFFGDRSSFDVLTTHSQDMARPV